jgi:opacity protein-like surface antigen
VHSSQRDLQAFPGNTSPFNVTGYDVLGQASASNGGGVIDVFAGWNTRLSNFVVGGQLEATAGALNFNSNGSKAYTYFDANGPTGSTANGDFRPQVTSRWMASALLRAGVVLNDRTLVYGIGGWTGAQFEARNLTDNAFYQPVESFWANGWTAGAGIERQLDSNWSVRAEYRYTGFAVVRTSDHFNFQFVGPAPGAQSSQRQTQFDQSMQSGRIGFAYAFNPLR